MLRTILFIGALLLSSLVWADDDYWPMQAWRTSTPEEQGIASEKLAEALLTMQQNKTDIHSLIIIRNGYMVVDAYFYPYDGTTVHDLASVTKSVMTTLIGIAADQGKLSLDDPMVSFFPERTIANLDAGKERITVRHLASMSSGLDCTSANDEQTLREMLYGAEDWVQFTLDRKMSWEPGTHFVYCSPAIHLLSPILQQATGMTALEFARQNLFEPLGIKDVIWPEDQGFNHGWGDLKLHPYDMAKIGYLWLNKGVWEGKQIVSSEWVEDSVKVHLKTGGDDDYGYGWWVETDEPAGYSAIGRGGQHIIVVPQWNLILVTTGGGFDFGEIEALVVATMADTEKPLAANPEGVAKLNAAVSSVVQPPTPQTVAPLPAIAKTVSGKTYLFETNPLGIETLGFVFDDSAEATVHIKFSGSELASFPVALDGVYRLFPGDYDLPMGLRGTWLDDRTFGLELDTIAGNHHTFLQLHFEDERVVVEARETSQEVSTTVEGRLQSQ